jgi:hypothetical protein
MQCPAYCFLLGNDLSCERNTFYLSAFSNGINIHFSQRNTAHLSAFSMGEIIILMKVRLKCWIKDTYIIALFSMEIRMLRILHHVPLWELSVKVKRILFPLQHFHIGETFALVQIDLFCWNKETYVSTGRISSELETGVLCTMLPIENWVSV